MTGNTPHIAAAGAVVMDEERQWVDFDGETFSVDAALIAEGFNIGSAKVQPLMRARKITSRCERGLDQDAGRYRLTFLHEDKQLRLVVDGHGEILQRIVEKRSPDTRRE